MASRASSTLLKKGKSIASKLESAFKPNNLEIKYASHPAATAPAAVEESAGETHYFVKIDSDKFSDKCSHKRVNMVHDALGDELQGLDALYVCARTALEVDADNEPIYQPVAAPRNVAAFHPVAASASANAK